VGRKLQKSTASVFGKEVVADNVKALLIYAIVSTVFTVRPPGGANAPQTH